MSCISVSIPCINASYSIHWLDTIHDILDDLLLHYPTARIFIITDENVWQLYESTILSHSVAGRLTDTIVLEAGESTKTLDTVASIYSVLNEHFVTSSDILVAIGGGVVSDIVGFVAGTYKRGIPYVTIPTTLLAQVDASIGGKTGVNFEDYKNNIGLYNPPSAIYATEEWLETLPPREIKSGFAEMLKHALIADIHYWDTLLDWQNLNWKEIILHSIQIKKSIVEQDMYEKNKRKLLNFGHTIGHALEIQPSFQAQNRSHGECVAIGMLAEIYISYMKKYLSEEVFTSLTQQLQKLYPIPLPVIDKELFIKAIQQDKKNKIDTISCVFLESIGKASIHTITHEDILGVYDYLTINTVID